jgi:integrase
VCRNGFTTAAHSRCPPDPVLANNTSRPKQRYFTQDQLKQIIEAAPGQYRVLFALLASTGMRIGEAAGLHLDDLDLDNGVIYVRRSVWNGQELEPKTENAVLEIDIDPTLVMLLREHVGATRRLRVFEARNGSPLSAGNIRKRVLHPLLAKLGIPKAGLHAFRHSRVTMLRKNGTPADLQKLDRPFELEDDRPLFAHGPGAGLSPERGAPRWIGPHCWTQPVQLDPSSIEGSVTAKAYA